MVNNIKLFINKYKLQIVTIAIMLIIGIAISLILNTYEKRVNINSNDSNNSEELGNDQAILDYTQVSQKEYSSNKSIIEEFAKNCRENPLKAYQMLADESLEKYDSYKKFKNEYVSIKFPTDMTQNIRVYSGNTYIIESREDIMATGIVNDTYSEEYITITSDNKLNIDGIISSVSKDSYAEFSNIYINIDKIKYCIDEAYITMTIHNYNDCDMILDSSRTKIGICVYNSNDLQFQYISTYNSDYDMEFSPYEKKQIEIKVPYILDDGVTLDKISFDYVKLGDEKISGKIMNM